MLPFAAGGTVIATELVVRAPPDAHVLLLNGPSYTINLFARKLPYDTERDFIGVARIAANPLLYSVHPSLPVRNIKDLVALARSKPGELTYATASPTGFQRLAADQYNEFLRREFRANEKTVKATRMRME